MMMAPLWSAHVLTLFPSMFPGPLGQSLAGRALADGIWSLNCVDIRDYATDKHRTVDDTPFGGGPGMVMRPDVVMAALDAALAGMDDAKTSSLRKIYFSPRGRRLDQAMVRDLAASDQVIMVCGRYEGLDQRVIDRAGLEEVSVGDVVLSGGELPALMTMDAVVRLLPGVMGNAAAHQDDSFEDGLLEHPLYTQPRDWQGMMVPDILTSGDHGKIAAWRKAESEAITQARRPDLWAEYIKAKGKKADG
jgi:tRNA (guanine37-N1)-methyltransferase